MYRLLSIVYFITLPLFVLGQRVEIIESARQYYNKNVFNSYLGKEKRNFIKQQEIELINQATRKALFKAYPSSITSASIKFTENINFNKFNAKTQSTYKRYMHEFANAELVKYLDKNCKQFIENEDICLECTVKIIAKKISDYNIEFTATTYDGTNINLDTETDFNEGQSLYVLFKTPVSGYLSIYLDDFNKTQKLLPYYYDSKNETCIKVNADTPYFLFSANKDHDMFYKPEIIDELKLGTISSYDLNRLYIIFSTLPFDKPTLETPIENNMSYEANNGYLKPKNTESDIFMNWLQKKRLKDKHIQVKIIDISIKRIN